MTRSKSAASKTKKRIYRSRVKNSRCRSRTRRSCKTVPNCETTKAGLRRSYCRKSKNTPV